ncbi:MAG: GrpB family protein [Chloroflexi bacterium]|nr:GrpB family protein [Chloroflexota bacterium]
MIVIVEPDPRWPSIFEAESRAIVGVIGDLLGSVEHIGSTSVPGLAAKPIVDILPGVARFADLDRCVEPLKGIGYTYVPEYEDDMPFRRFFRKRPPPSPYAFNVHVVEYGCDFWQEDILFRDYLRAHPDAAREYERLKRELAPKYADVNEYADAKTAFIQAIRTRARADPRGAAWRCRGHDGRGRTRHC